MEQAKEYVRAHTDQARSYLAQGKSAEFGRSLLDVVLMIVTPIIR
jgi:hypothetical protein